MPEMRQSQDREKCDLDDPRLLMAERSEIILRYHLNLIDPAYRCHIMAV